MDLIATEFGHEVVDISLGQDGVEQSIYITVTLSNGRELFIDDRGILDSQDVDRETRLAKQNFNYASWEEILELLDGFRAEAMN